MGAVPNLTDAPRQSAPLHPEIRVNGVVVPAAAIAAEAQNHPAPPGKPGLAWRKAARALVIRALLLEEAARRGLSPEPRDLGEGRRETDEESLIRQTMEAAIHPAPPTEAMIRAAYEARPEGFRTPPLWEASHLLLESEEAARAAAAELARDPSGFAALARARSQCPSRERGGRLGPLSPGDTVPEFEAALAALEPGAVSGPVRSRFGWHLIRLEARAEGRPPPYEAVRGRIGEALERAAWTRAAQAFTRDLAKGARIEGIDLDF